MDIVELIPSLRPIVAAVDELEGRHGRTFLVGGAVRDAIIGAEVIDLAFAIEGAGIDFARDLAATLGGSATPYGDFGTATVAFAQGSFDAASTRSELYASQGALPTVEPAGIGEDLLRRDFTMNAMAVALDSAERGVLLDPLDGEADIASGTVRVIHDASFADDPTRLVRAARYEARFTFSLDSHSESLARSSVEAGYVIDRAAGSALELNARCVAAVSLFDLHQALIGEPLEAVVIALAAADTTASGREKLGSFLTTLRHVSLTVTGDDLAKLGLADSPAVGRILSRLRQMKLAGEFTTIADELEAARELIRSGELN